MKCDNCSQSKPLAGAVINGKFGHYCHGCITDADRQATAQSAQYQRARDVEDNRRDLLQPRDRRGQPNRQFIEQYPEESAKIFTKEELIRHG